nr:PREDICTED: basic helix-loop-helix and HMG box domain-containing protein 1 isoform X1 [Latimeria chalumnae]|eukprot:XP_014341370.1 PREDICTED: basic helix-loop-helix and HMG box domain-containing protein 1 isoform X1 [Latimeria chalumnae]
MLRELAELLPLQTNKQLTKKEILIRILQYIEHLHRHINLAKTYLAFQRSNCHEFIAGEDEPSALDTASVKSEGKDLPCTPPRSKKWQPVSACKKPRKKICWARADGRLIAPKSRRRLSLEFLQCTDPHCGDSTEEHYGRARNSGTQRTSSSPPDNGPCLPGSLDSGFGSHCNLASSQLEMTKPGLSYCSAAEWRGELQQPYALDDDVCSTCEGRLVCDETSLYDVDLESPLYRAKNQELVNYLSSSEEDEDTDTSPWLSMDSPQFHSCGKARNSLSTAEGRGKTLLHLPCGSRWGNSHLLGRDLGLSPSLFTSPGRHFAAQFLHEGQEHMSQVLFEDVCLSPASTTSWLSLASPGNYRTLQVKEEASLTVLDTPSQSSGSLQSAFSLDHCYLSMCERIKTGDSPSSEVQEYLSAWNKQILQEDSESDHCLYLSDENKDCTWTPSKKGKTSHHSNRKRKSSHAFKRLKAMQKRHCPFQLKKKCVNGFIMFCRLNRKQYIRAYPGTASTAATKELAHLWRIMSKRERKPYCIKAREYSKLHNRVVKLYSSSSDEEETEVPKPLHLLLAEKTLFSRATRVAEVPLPTCHEASRPMGYKETASRRRETSGPLACNGSDTHL